MNWFEWDHADQIADVFKRNVVILDPLKRGFNDTEGLNPKSSLCSVLEY